MMTPKRVWLCVSVGLLFFLRAVPSVSQNFKPPVTYASGAYGAFSVAVADLNGDGKPDLVAANYYTCDSGGCGGGAVGVLLGNGDGTFQAAVLYGPGGSNPVSVAIADLNGDGKLDLVVGNICADAACASGAVGILLGNGDGTFRPAVSYTPADHLTSVAVADVNRDGKPDLLVVNYGNCLDTCTDGSVGVLLGNGDGTFQPAVPYDVGSAGALSVAVADVNGDGRPDLLVATSCSSNNCAGSAVGVLMGNGDGSFQAAMLYSSGGRVSDSVAVADVNGDGKPDLLVANYCGFTGYCTTTSSGAVGVLLGNGDGTFRAAASYGSGGFGADSLAVADVNGDGKPDLLVLNQCGANGTCARKTNGTVGVLLGNGDGTFRSAELYNSGGFDARSLAVADVNRDGKPDLLVANVCGNSTCQGTLKGTVGVLLNSSGVHNPTSTSLTSSLNPSVYGQAVTWTATVTSPGSTPPTGKVTFSWNGNTIGTAMLDASGVATLTRSNLNADVFSLTAVYSGDANNLGSASAVLNQVVQEATSAATITSLPNPSMQGQLVTFTARITSATVVPTGPVTFTAGKTVLGTAQLGSGHAKLTISSLPVGSTKVTATYNGDSNIAKSSASITQTVR